MWWLLHVIVPTPLGHQCIIWIESLRPCPNSSNQLDDIIGLNKTEEDHLNIWNCWQLQYSIMPLYNTLSWNGYMIRMAQHVSSSNYHAFTHRWQIHKGSWLMINIICMQKLITLWFFYNIINFMVRNKTNLNLNLILCSNFAYLNRANDFS